jgi:hypothetical protein
VKLCRVPARDITAMAQALVEANPTEWLAKAKASSVVQDEIRRLQAKARTIVVRRLKVRGTARTALNRMKWLGFGDYLGTARMSSSTNAVHPLAEWALPE